MAYYLGISASGVNPSAALLRDGELVAFAEEERFVRVKNAPGAYPFAAMHFCLERAGIEASDLAGIGFAWDCERYVAEMPAFFESLRQRWSEDTDAYNRLHERRLLATLDPHRIRTDLQLEFARRGQKLDPGSIAFLPHHRCHAASAYLSTGWSEASVLTLDGSGEEIATVLWHARGLELRELARFDLPHTLGGYYATFTEYLGFRSDREEGKLMGLAAYGRFRPELQSKLQRVLDLDAQRGDYRVDPRFRFYGPRSQGQRFTDALTALLGPPRPPGGEIEDRHRDIAFNVQWRLEAAAAALVRRLVRETDCGDLCLAGGVAMNCKMNGEIARLEEVRRIFVQPAAGDNGVSLGAAMLCALSAGVDAFSRFEHAYWGPSYGDAEIVTALDEAKLVSRRSGDLFREVARHLHQGRIVGWFQGAMEVGARSLGNRSILASPLGADMRDRLNRQVKHREAWRPFCPSVVSERYRDYFPDGPEGDFMIVASELRERLRGEMPAVVHVDGTARPQAVRRETNPRFHALLRAFGEISGHPVLVNTSFNVQGEPIVATPTDALRCFGGTGIDVLVMGDHVVEKSVGSVPGRGDAA